MISEITTRPIHVRHTAVDGKSYVAEHVVWDAPGDSGSTKYIAARQRECDGLNADAAKPGDDGQLRPRGKAKAELITQDQYTKERNRK